MVSLAAVEEATELAEAYGLALDPWQVEGLEVGMGERADGSWAASSAAMFTPRQNGKGDWLNARELWGLIVGGERLQIHTAHEFPTANEMFLRLVAVFDAFDDLRKRVARIRYANGEQGIELLSGQRLKYRARTGGSGRGFAEADLVVYDEAQHLQPEHVAASMPTIAASPRAQIWYAGSPGMSSSEVAWRLRKRAVGGDGGRLGYVEHTAELVSFDGEGRLVSVHPAIEDRAAWARANPAFPARISDESLSSLLAGMGPDLFIREHLGVWEPEPGSAEGAPIPSTVWAGLRDEGSDWASHLCLGLDVAPSHHMSCFGVAARRSDGRLHVEPVERRAGTGWVVDRAVELHAKWRVPVRVVKGSPAAAFVTLMRERGVDVTEVALSEYAAAVGQFRSCALNDGLRHLGAASLDSAVAAAVVQSHGDTEVWSRRHSSSDITPLVAVTVALGGVPDVRPSTSLFVACT